MKLASTGRVDFGVLAPDIMMIFSDPAGASIALILIFRGLPSIISQFSAGIYAVPESSKHAGVMNSIEAGIVISME